MERAPGKRAGVEGSKQRGLRLRNGRKGAGVITRARPQSLRFFWSRGRRNYSTTTGARSIRKFPKFPKIPVQNRMEQKIFRKFVSKISVNLSRLSLFLETWKFRKFPVPFGISTRYESSPVPIVVKSYKMAARLSSYTTLDAKWSAIVRACSWSKTKTLEFDSLENCGLVVPNFLWVSLPGLHTLPREEFVSFSH